MSPKKKPEPKGREPRFTSEVTLRLEPETLDALDNIAASETRDRANVIRIILTRGITTYKQEGRL